MSMEEALCLPVKKSGKIKALNPDKAVEKAGKGCTPPITTFIMPSKTEVYYDLVITRNYLNQLREDLRSGKRQPTQAMKTELFATQLILSADKIMLEGLKEQAKLLEVNVQNNTAQIDITAQMSELHRLGDILAAQTNNKYLPSPAFP